MREFTVVFKRRPRGEKECDGCIFDNEDGGGAWIGSNCGEPDQVDCDFKGIWVMKENDERI